MRRDNVTQWFLRPLHWPARLFVLGVVLAVPTATDAQPKWADPAKTLHVMMEGGEAGFDPQAVGDFYSFTIVSAIFDALYQTTPRRIAGPQRRGRDAGDLRRWPHLDDPDQTGCISRLIRHSRHAARARRTTSCSREAAARPKVRSPNVEILADRSPVRVPRSNKPSRVGASITTPIEDCARRRHTLQLRLVEPDYTLLPYLSFSGLAAVAREVIEAHASADGRAMEHPVGTGPYKMVEWRRGQKVVLEANPNYREEYFPDAPVGADATAKTLAAAMHGKRLPQAGRVEISVIEEPQPALLAFESGALDILELPFEIAPKAIDASGRLLPAFASRGVTLQRVTDLYLGYLYFNMDDAIVGGVAPERIALRRAVVMAYDAEQEISVIRNGQGRPATQPVPPYANGHVPGLDVRARTIRWRREPARQVRLRDRDGDGLRESPSGQR
jgi:ABC-type transport system substrate-binding protein